MGVNGVDLDLVVKGVCVGGSVCVYLCVYVGLSVQTSSN